MKRVFFQTLLFPFLLLVWMGAHLPFFLQIFLGKMAGRVLWCVAWRAKYVAKTNIALAFPQESACFRKKLLRKNIESLGIFMFELGMSLYAPKWVLKSRLTVKNRHYLDEALSAGQGAFLLAPHMMCVELVGRLFAQECALAVVYRPQKLALLEHLNKTRLLRYYRRAVPRQDIRGMLRALADNLPMFYTPDVDAGRRNSAFVPFFGTMAATVTATSKLVKLSHAAVVPIAFYRTKNNRGYELVFEKPITLSMEDIVADCTQINRVLESLILHSPAQYLWTYKRYKTRPTDDEPRFYSR